MTALNQSSGDPFADIASHDTYLAGFPHATFQRLRAEEPVSWTVDGDGTGFWSVTTHEPVVEVSRDYGRFTASRGIRIEVMDVDELEARRSMMRYWRAGFSMNSRRLATSKTGRRSPAPTHSGT